MTDPSETMTHDGSDVRRTQRLHELNRKLRLVEKMARIGHWSLDPAVGVPEWSDEVYRIYERDPARGPHSLADYRRLYEGEWYETFHAAIRGAIDACRPYDIELRLVLPSGKVKWVHAIGEPERDRGPHGHRVHGTIQDISERMAAEEARRRLQERLAGARKMEALGRLAGGVAHDFNNVLSVILGNADLLREDLDEDDPARARVEEIGGAAQRASDLVRQLLGFARRQAIRPVALDINEAVASTLKMLERLIGENIALRWQPGDLQALVRADPSQVDQILSNLVINARDAIDGSGSIEIATSLERVDEEDHEASAWMRPGEYVMLSVADDGCGMDAEVLRNIFEPFFTTKDVGKGTGLGLATVYGIVKQNGGFVHAESRPGRGATLRLYFPVCRDLECAGERSAAGPTPAAAPRSTILLVEDEPAILELEALVLRKAGHDVLAADSPRRALEIARERDGGIDLLVTDVVMPEMNGRELADRLRNAFPAMQRLFISGYDETVMARQGVEPSAAPLLQKPFLPRDFMASVDAVLGGRNRPDDGREPA